ncbi:hypothetical protein E4T43_01321 [Aureobasidium subglaciale]|nr:hypothetical protein E4T43_01321 [Aureobasidium subglaciale]
MPAKIDTELNLRFLYICFKHSNFSTVDFHEVASYFQIKAPAARMRLMRLRQALEAESSREGFRERDRRRKLNPFKAKDKLYALDGEDDDDETLDDMPLMQRLHARMMRVKREDGLMIKNEDGTLIKDEDTAMIKSEDVTFWGKKEEDLDDQDETKMTGIETRDLHGTSFKSEEVNDSRLSLKGQPASGEMFKSEVVSPSHAPASVQHDSPLSWASSGQRAFNAKSEDSPPLAQPTIPSYGPVKMELNTIDTKRQAFGYGNQQSPAPSANTGLFNFRAYDHTNTSGPPIHGHDSSVKPESTNTNGHFFHNYSSHAHSHPDVFNPFAQVKPESTYCNTQMTTPSGLSSPFRLDAFNTTLANSLTLGDDVGPKPGYADSLFGSPHIKDDTGL